jgi:hypothetical protein
MWPINMYEPHGHCVVPGGKSLLLTVIMWICEPISINGIKSILLYSSKQHQLMFEMLIAYLVMLFVLLEHLQELPEK